MSQGGGLDGQLGIELMVERAAAGEAPSSPQPPEAGDAAPAHLVDVAVFADGDDTQGVSMRSLATSMAPSKTSLPFKRPSRSNGTLAPAHLRR